MQLILMRVVVVPANLRELGEDADRKAYPHEESPHLGNVIIRCGGRNMTPMIYFLVGHQYAHNQMY